MSIRRNTIYNILGSAVPLAVSLVTIPIYLRLIGEARYGTLAIAWLLLGYFGLFDLGLGRAVAQRIAAQRNSSADERASTFWTALILNIGLGIVGGLIIWPFAVYFFGEILLIEGELHSEMQDAVPWLVLAVPMATLTGVLTGALQGRERFLELNLISISGTVLFQVFPLLTAIIAGPHLDVILPAALAARLSTMIVLFECCRRHILRGNSATVDRSQVRNLLSFGSWVTVSSFVGPMMVFLDRFIIGAVLGANAVTYYTVPFQISERTTIISNALTFALFPRFAASDRDEERRLAGEGLNTLAVVVTPLMVVGIFILGPFLEWWISPEFADRSLLIGQITLLGFWVNGFAKIPYAQLQARGRPDLVAKSYLAEILPFFGMLYLGLNLFGLTGAAIAFSFRVLVDFVLLAGFAGMMRMALRILLFPSLLMASAFVIALQYENGRPEWLFVAGPHLLGTMAWAWWQAPAPLLEIVISRLRPFRKFSEKNETIGSK